MADPAKTLDKLQSVIKESRGFLSDISEEERDVDRKQDSIENFLKSNSGEFSRQQVDRLEEMLGQEGNELDDELQRMEQDIQGHFQMLELLKNFEDLIGSQERQTYQELETVKREIRGLNQRMAHDTVDNAIRDLENAVGEMSQEADEILKAAQLLSGVEKTSGKEFQLEKHLEQEVQRFNNELDAVERAVQSVGGQKEQEYASKIENMREKIDGEMRTENRQVRNEVQGERKLVEEVKQEAENYVMELREAYEEAQAVESRIQGSQGFKGEEKEIGKIVNKIEQQKEEADQALKIIRKDRSFISRLLN